MSFRRVFSAAPWESQVGYCRALRAGERIYVTGTAPVGADGRVVAPGDGYAQARRCLEIIERALVELGVDRTRVVRTRMYVTDIARWAEFGRAHRPLSGGAAVRCSGRRWAAPPAQRDFGAHPPTTTMVQVAALIDPAMLIEIEADAEA